MEGERKGSANEENETDMKSKIGRGGAAGREAGSGEKGGRREAGRGRPEGDQP